LVEDAKKTLARGDAVCPNDPELLAAKGRVEVATGELRNVRRYFGRAHAFGSKSADVLHWLGRNALASGAPIRAKAVEEEALAHAPVAAHKQRAEMNEVLARACFLVDD